jgi:hypothetical protein
MKDCKNYIVTDTGREYDVPIFKYITTSDKPIPLSTLTPYVDEVVYTDQNGLKLYSDGESLVSINGQSTKRLTTIMVGNSITAQCQVADGKSQFNAGSEMVWANIFSGGAFRLPELSSVYISSVNFCDSRGVHGHGGATSTTIANEVDSMLFKACKSSNVIPDLLWIHALFENDLGQDLSVDTSIANLNKIIALARAAFPNIKILIGKCRPSASVFPNATRLANFIELNSRLDSYADGKITFVYDPGASYSESTARWKTVKAVGTISGTTLTVNSITDNTTIGLNQLVTITTDYVPGWTYATITNTGTTNGGVGTYTITNASGLAITNGNIEIHTYTDTVVHPTPPAVMCSARVAISAIGSLISNPVNENKTVSSNPALTGSVALTGTNIVPGSTTPTGCVYSAGTLGWGLITTTALNPGLRFSVTNVNTSGLLFKPLGSLLLTDFTPTIPYDAVRPYAVVKIRSGAEFIRSISINPRYKIGATQLGIESMYNFQSSHADGEFRNGDIVKEIILCPYRSPDNGANYITNVKLYLQTYIKSHTPTDAIIEFDVIDCGFEVIDDNTYIATLVAGTVTVSSPLVTQSSKVFVARRNQAGTVGQITETARVPGTSITFTSSSATDTSSIIWKIL